MEHQIIVLIHLIGAILFVGALALEVIVLEPIKKYIGEEIFQKFEFYLFRRIKRTYWVGVLPIYVTGFYMYSRYIDGYGSFGALIATDFGKLLTLKLIIAIGLLFIFAAAPFLFMKKQANPIKHFFIITGTWKDFRIDRFELIHYIALSLGVLLVIIGKVLWMI
jgi:hypothetical protein